MAENEIIVLDTDKATDIAYLIEMRDKVLLQHGGTVTQMQFSEVRQMTLDWWVEHEAPKLKKLDRSLIVLRDTMSSAFTLMTGDQVLEYKLDNVAEVPLDQLVGLISTEQVEEVITPNLPWPLVAKVVKGGNKNITVELPSMLRHMSIPMMEVDDDIYYPPVWFNAGMTTSNVLGISKICVVPERSLEWEQTKLFKMSLPNVHSDGSICFGSATATARIDNRAPTEAEMVQSAMSLFFDSNFNNHLIYSTTGYETMIERAWPNATKKDHFMKKKGFTQFSGMLKLLCCLADPNGWRLVKWEPLSYNYGYGAQSSSATLLTAKRFVGL